MSDDENKEEYWCQLSPWSNQDDPASAGDASKAENPQENPVESFYEIFD